MEKQLEKQGRIEEKWTTFLLSNLPLLEGNMPYLISILVVDYLDGQYRWKFTTSSTNLKRYFDIKFVLLLCTWGSLYGRLSNFKLCFNSLLLSTK